MSQTLVANLVEFGRALRTAGMGVVPEQTRQFAKSLELLGFSSRRDVMGVLVNRRGTTAVASVVAGLIVALNLYLLFQTFAGG